MGTMNAQYWNELYNTYRKSYAAFSECSQMSDDTRVIVTWAKYCTQPDYPHNTDDLEIFGIVSAAGLIFA